MSRLLWFFLLMLVIQLLTVKLKTFLGTYDIQNEILFEAAGEFQLKVIGSENEEEVDIEVNNIAKPSQKRKRATKSGWKESAKFRSAIPFEAKPGLSSLFPMLKGLQPIDLWQLLFDKVTVDNLMDETQLYAVQDKNTPEFVIDNYKMMRFLGILILSGYHTLPEEVHYWSNQPDLGTSIVAEAISSKRFSEIKRYLHIADNRQLQRAQKAAKVLPLYDSLNQFGIWHSSLSIDDSMVPYFRRHSIKMFIRGKPIRFVWS
jgi:Transposase IS4